MRAFVPKPKAAFHPAPAERRARTAAVRPPDARFAMSRSGDASEQEAQRARQRKTQVGTGDRSAKIRTYNFPQGRVTDHRIGLTMHRLGEVMNGDLDELVAALKDAREAEYLDEAS